MDSLNTITFWISNIAGVLSVLTIIIWILLLPSSDKRFGSGYKDNAEASGCGMPIFAIITGLIAYFISEDGYFYIFISVFSEEILPAVSEGFSRWWRQSIWSQ